ncbi:MAG: hypothetical protein PHW13_06390 [Methylococcales bacterium]|nr:hypothetical protein [Methylococcales bacterium]
MMARWLTDALGFLRRSRDDQLQWHLSRQHDRAELRQARALAEQARAAQLKKQAQQLAHELAVAKTRNNSDLAMVKTRCRQELKDYQQYLQSLEKLKKSLRDSYAHLPEAVAFTIHHHAKQLLNRMWETSDTQEKIRIEMQLLQFMTAVHEDNQASLLTTSQDALPKKALAFIDAESD